jgi:hypothetical protein
LAAICILSGCYLRPDVEPAKLIHDPKNLEPQASAGLSEAEAGRLVQVLKDRSRLGRSHVPDDNVIDALERISIWKSPPSRREGRECFPGIDAVVNLFHDPSADVRYYAVDTAGKVGCDRIVKELQLARKSDRSRLVREAAAEALIALRASDEAWEE